ncbi:MAG: DNA primase [Minisyncoccota bacterium]
MGGNVEEIKERLDIAEVIGGYIKVEKTGANFKAKCPFHNEKTASFFISTQRQNYYCFGCGAKGDIFNFVEEMESVDFKGALKILADRAGIELELRSGTKVDDKDELYKALNDATLFFESEFEKSNEAKKYVKSRGINNDSSKDWRIGFAPNEWRSLRSHMLALGYTDEVLVKAGLIKRTEESKSKEPYDTFRGRIIFPLFDPRGKIIAFSGRALLKDAEPKYLNSPDTPLFTKSEVLYGLDRAREEIRKKDYAVLVEGQMDLVLSHQAGVKNTVASSGTSFTIEHLERLKRLSPRVLLAFDADSAGMKAAEKSTAMAQGIGMEVKIAELPEGKDPADLAKDDSENWKETLRKSRPAIEVFLDNVLKGEKDPRKSGKAIERKILPYVAMVQSSMERSYFVSLISKRTGMREEAIVEDLKRVKLPEILTSGHKDEEVTINRVLVSIRDKVVEELELLKDLEKNLPTSSKEYKALERKKVELEGRLSQFSLEDEIVELKMILSRGEGDTSVLERFQSLSRKLDEVKRKIL